MDILLKRTSIMPHVSRAVLVHLCVWESLLSCADLLVFLRFSKIGRPVILLDINGNLMPAVKRDANCDEGK